MEEAKLKSIDNYELNLHIFKVNNPKGYIQLIHGMEEHQERYEPFIEQLNKQNYTVISSNMRGHGSDAKNLGFFKEKKGYEFLLLDQKEITKYIKKTFNTNKVIIFAHSMGTIITRNLLQTESKDYEKVILSGFPCPQAFVGVGIFLANLIQLFKGPMYYSKALQQIAIGSFNNKIDNSKTNLDWLSVNEENVKNYMEDPFCGHGFKVSALNDLFHLTKYMSKASRYKYVNTSLPILMLRGDEDPCTGFDNGSKKSINVLKKAGFNNIKEIKYQNMRHEILNEANKNDVYNDVIKFLND
ncbi:MAG: alpha/beta hydrolase [Candidatus Caccosoma sp.]|nr:alpha/beta hydrolase [Candidatus Caccosoma sp.]